MSGEPSRSRSRSPHLAQGDRSHATVATISGADLATSALAHDAPVSRSGSPLQSPPMVGLPTASGHSAPNLMESKNCSIALPLEARKEAAAVISWIATEEAVGSRSDDAAVLGVTSDERGREGESDQWANEWLEALDTL